MHGRFLCLVLAILAEARALSLFAVVLCLCALCCVRACIGFAFAFVVYSRSSFLSVSFSSEFDFRLWPSLVCSLCVPLCARCWFVFHCVTYSHVALFSVVFWFCVRAVVLPFVCLFRSPLRCVLHLCLLSCCVCELFSPCVSRSSVCICELILYSCVCAQAIRFCARPILT